MATMRLADAAVMTSLARGTPFALEIKKKKAMMLAVKMTLNILRYVVKKWTTAVVR